MLRAVIIVLLIISALPVFCQEDSLNPIIRVCIIDDAKSIHLALKDGYAIYPLGSGNIILKGSKFGGSVKSVPGGLVIGKSELRFPRIKIKVFVDSTIYVNGRSFRGSIDIAGKPNGNIMVINEIPMESYLCGVLYHEVSPKWPMEVLKAQAIVARTFALYQMNERKADLFDVRNDIYSQVYGGSTSEKWTTNRAVNLTRGEVLAYNGKLFPAYYHATCGGITEDAAALWSIVTPPLRGGVKCAFCKDSPHYKWHKAFSSNDLWWDLRKLGSKLKNIASIEILSRTRSGRVDKMVLRDDLGAEYAISGKDFRQMAGPNIVRSLNFEASVRGEFIVLTGYGWGHGVGLCQWGARGMSLAGHKAEDIIKHYYPQSEIVNIDKVR